MLEVLVAGTVATVAKLVGVSARSVELLGEPDEPLEHAPRVSTAPMASVRAVDALLEATRDGDAWVRYYAARALSEQRAPAALPRLSEMAREAGAMHVRIAALEAVGAIDGPQAADILLPHAEGEDGELATAALRALGSVAGHPRAAATLRAALRSTDPARRVAAVAGLSGQPESETIAALQWTASADEDARVTAAAVEALGTLARRAGEAGDAAVNALIVLTAEQPRSEAAVAALAALPVPRIGGVAAGLADARPAVRRAIISALGRMKHPDASAAIRSALDDPEPAVREAAVTLLERLGAQGVARRFAEMARADQSRAVRLAAAAALSRQGPANQDATRE